MFRKVGEHRRSRHENLRGGRGSLEMTHFLEEGESFGSGRLFARAILPPGASIGEHPHNGEFEVYNVVRGTAHVTDNGVLCVMETGDTHVCLDGDRHGIENRSDQDLEMLFLVLYGKK